MKVLLLHDVDQKSFDALTLTQTSTTDVWKYFNGGTSGNLVLTITISYTDSGKGTIVSVVRS